MTRLGASAAEPRGAKAPKGVIMSRKVNPVVGTMRTLLKDENFVILDTETTGLGRADEVVQIGILSPKGKELMNTLVCPTMPSAMQPSATDVHGITAEMLVGKPTIKDLEPDLVSILSNKFIVAYNAQFDKRMLAQSATAVNAHRVLSEIPCQWIDVMRPYKVLMGTKKWQSLTNACIQQGIAIENAHEAMGDCHLLLKLIKRISEM